jgi:DNA-binding NarL/FixJ family response regulator/anti-sigma regulatory factor (Ser/Thr protein kinase)
MLKQLGLVPTLSWLVQQISNQYDLQIQFTHESINRVKLHHSIELAAFRILQEALMNVVQHANVDTVEVKIWAENNLIHIDIVDEGLGFNMAQTLSHTRTHGLFTMQERALAVGGTCTVRSRPNDGTVVSVKLPQQFASSQSLALQEMLQAPQMYGQKRYESSTAQAGSVRVIVAEENELVRQGITRLLEKSGRYAIRAEVQTLHGLRNLVQDMEADLLLFSFTLSESNIAQVLFDLSKTRPQMKIVVLSTQPEAAYAQSSLQNGAKAYILKQSGTATLLNALDSVLDGKEVIDAGVKQTAIRQQQPTGTKAESDAYHSLTRREREILFLVLEGLQNMEIADKLVISPRTVETHRSNMMRKLGVRGQAALMRFAVNMGLISAS